jgi:hypothetical protein
MTGTVTLTGKPTSDNLIKKYEIDWTSNAAGAAGETVGPFIGVLLRVVFNPGTAAPSDNYDVTLSDEDGVDVLSGLGANRDTSTTEEIIPLLNGSDGTNTTPLPRAICGNLTLAVTNAGDSKTGKITLYMR